MQRHASARARAHAWRGSLVRDDCGGVFPTRLRRRARRLRAHPRAVCGSAFRCQRRLASPPSPAATRAGAADGVVRHRRGSHVCRSCAGASGRPCGGRLPHCFSLSDCSAPSPVAAHPPAASPLTRTSSHSPPSPCRRQYMAMRPDEAAAKQVMDEQHGIFRVQNKTLTALQASGACRASRIRCDRQQHARRPQPSPPRPCTRFSSAMPDPLRSRAASLWRCALPRRRSCAGGHRAV